MAIDSSNWSAAKLAAIGSADVHAILSGHMLADGFELVVDLDKSHGSWLVDARTGVQYLDFFCFFASLPLGVNPPQLVKSPSFMRQLAAASVNKPSNPDLYTVEYARFVATFARVLGDPSLPYLFFVDGGALAVENALKAAFDWKAKRRARSRGLDEVNLRVLHLEMAFHGRSGYTLSLTNTDRVKTALFPKFDWPRIPVPAARFPLDRYIQDNVRLEDAALAAARTAFEQADDDIACFIAEPIQGEGGDNHLRPEFLQAMQALCREYDALFVLDEVQTGCGTTGSAWAYQQLGVEPDIVAFGKKTQVCGVMAGRRIDEVADNVFRTSSRISSTWGGNLADMVRATRILEVIEEQGLFAAAAQRGDYLVGRLNELSQRYPDMLSNPRGRGVMCAVDVRDSETRDLIIRELRTEEHVMVLAAGTRTLRLRPALTVSEAEIGLLIDALERRLKSDRR
jgi:L-lysine 6-transaminase